MDKKENKSHLSSASEQEKLRQLAKEYSEKAHELFSEEQFQESLVAAENALVIYKQLSDGAVCARLSNYIGVVLGAIGNELAAMDRFLEALEYAEEFGANDVLPAIYNNIGSRYQELEKHDKAIYYFMKANAATKKWRYLDKDEDRFIQTRLIIHMNLAFSSICTEQYDKAEEYLDIAAEIMKETDVPGYHFVFLYLTSQLKLHTGNPEYAKEHLDEMMHLAKEERGGSDYLQSIKCFNSLLRDMGEYNYLSQAISLFEEYAEEHNNAYFRILALEMRIEYCELIGDVEQYTRLCVQHTKLFQIQRERELMERSHALDVKIALKDQEDRRKKAELLNADLKLKSEIDALTGVGNRYALEVYATNQIRKYSKNEHRMTIGVVDIDCFKQVNDTYGHSIGDQCLSKVSEVLCHVVADAGKVFRFGGDEFVILLNQGGVEEAEQIAKEIQSELAMKHLENKNSIVCQEITVSQGYATLIPDKASKVIDLLEYADRALYQVKNTTRNHYHIVAV